MPICPTHGKPMVRVNQGFETRGEGWNKWQIYYEEHLCQHCQFRLRRYYRIINLGRVKEGGGTFGET